MAIHIEKQTEPGGSYTAVDLTGIRLTQLKLSRSYDGPARLSFVLLAPNHTLPLEYRTFLRLWDDAGINPLSGEDADPFDADHPLFEGFVEDVKPGGDGLSVAYVCLDPTYRAAIDARVMSLPWDAPVGSAPPTRATGATTRIVFNADSILADEDAAHSRTNGASVGGIIKTLLDDQTEPLRYINAAPPDPDVPYVLTGELTGLDFIPQEKVVFQDENLRSAFMRVLQYEPKWRQVWYPGERRWRFGDVTASPAVDITLNDFTDANPYHVGSLDLTRTLDGRATAVRFTGPARIQNTTVSTEHGEVGIVSDGLLTGPTTGTGPDGETHYYYTIDDPDFRRMAGVLEVPISTPYQRDYGADADSIFVYAVLEQITQFPVLQARFPDGDSGDGGWYTIPGWTSDKISGVIDVGREPIRRPIYPREDPLTYEDPLEVRLIFGRYIDPFQVRYPETGYEGSAFDDFGLENELSIYDEMLTVGSIYNHQITTVTRLARFLELAERIHETIKDTAYTGGLTLEGLVYDFAFLDRRVNLPAVDEDGAPLTTGWESIGAIVTDVEYDFSAGMTTIQFSADLAALAGVDIERAKEELKIRAATPVIWTAVNLQYGYQQTRGPLTGIPYLSQSMSWSFTWGINWVDEQGEAQ